MTGYDPACINKIKTDFLAAYHTLKFSKEDKDDMQKADIERRCIAMKYLSARLSDSVEVASCVLSRDLDHYQKLMENKNGVNNYWKEIKAITPKLDNDPLKWNSSLKDLNVALSFVKPLSCQKDNTALCKNKEITDMNVQSMVDLWKHRNAIKRNQQISNEEEMDFDCISNFTNNTINNQEDMDIDYSSSSSTFEDLNDNKQVSYNKGSLYQSALSEKHHSAYKQPVKLLHKPQLHTKSNINVTSISNCNYLSTFKDKPKEAPTVRKFKPSTSIQHCEEDSSMASNKINSFRTARDELNIQQQKINKQPQKRTLGGKAVNTQFVCPLKREKEKILEESKDVNASESNTNDMEDERYKNVDPKMIELIRNEIMNSKTLITWDDIAGLEYVKKIIKEVVVYPMLRPDIFTGLRGPPKGILLFGPPGTGKTLIGKCIASQSKSTFFSISASSLTSKWVGEGEKMVRALFAVARVHQPSVVFIDEIDSLLSQRSETEHESSRRLKTEFLVHLDGATTTEDDRILIVGATNRPHELDEAARRRLVKRLYIPLPEFEARKQIINNLLGTIPNDLTDEEIEDIAKRSEGYSGADMTNLCKEASMGPIRSIPLDQLEFIKTEEVRQVTIGDFSDGLINVRPSVSQSDLSLYVKWDKVYGSGTPQNPKI
ncbi:hypothetical protein KM043_018719 [Ampulex compressa]|nr:hypothetical protein KM043_018719 [Ampulex compressa]